MTCVHYRIEFAWAGTNGEAVMCDDEEEKAERPTDRRGGLSHIGDVLEELLAEVPIRLAEIEPQAIEEPVAV